MGDDSWFRWMLALIFGSAVFISSYHRRRARAISGTIERSREDPRLIAWRVAITLPLLFGLLAFLFHPPLMGWSRIPLPVTLRWLGVATGVLCVPLVFWVVSSLGANISETVLTKADHELVTHGPYRWVRHPLYATGLLLLTSASLITASWLVGGLTVLSFFGIRFVVIPREESALVAKFGDRYRAYMAETGALLPALRA